VRFKETTAEPLSKLVHEYAADDDPGGFQPGAGGFSTHTRRLLDAPQRPAQPSQCDACRSPTKPDDSLQKRRRMLDTFGMHKGGKEYRRLVADSNESSAPPFSLQPTTSLGEHALSIWRDSRSCARRRSGTVGSRRIKPHGRISRTSSMAWSRSSHLAGMSGAHCARWSVPQDRPRHARSSCASGRNDAVLE